MFATLTRWDQKGSLAKLIEVSQIQIRSRRYRVTQKKREYAVAVEGVGTRKIAVEVGVGCKKYIMCLPSLSYQKQHTMNIG